jgi:hypothetical protein
MYTGPKRCTPKYLVQENNIFRAIDLRAARCAVLLCGELCLNLNEADRIHTVWHLGHC